MNVALIGYGKMGKEIEKILLVRGHSVSLKVTSENANFSAKDLEGSDVAIEFSIPSAATRNIRKCFEANLPIAVGTTAWYDDFESIHKECLSSGNTLFHASNFSLGVNIFFEMNKKLAQIMNHFEEYEVSIEEIHHTEKLDAPSGTAITTAECILSGLERKTTWALDESGTSVIPVMAKRLPDVPGTHAVTYESEIDRIELKHEAKNRKGFALGAVLAAEYIKDKRGVFTMNDLLNLS